MHHGAERSALCPPSSAQQGANPPGHRHEGQGTPLPKQPQRSRLSLEYQDNILAVTLSSWRGTTAPPLHPTATNCPSPLPQLPTVWLSLALPPSPPPIKCCC